MKVLFTGETWATQETHLKGFDSVDLCRVEMDPAKVAFDAIKNSGIEVEHMAGHLVHYQFPETAEELKQYDAVIISDVGSNTFLLNPLMMFKGVRKPNRLQSIVEYVNQGGGLIMFGGYLSFSGIENKARYAMSPLANALPVTMLNYDDRVENPEGVVPRILIKNHPVLSGLEELEWPWFLGYNKIKAKAEAQEIAVIGQEDTFMAGLEYGKGRTFAFASDCAPHWGADLTVWSGYQKLLSNIIKWVARKI
jgi:uncharacterized membrane protein